MGSPRYSENLNFRLTPEESNKLKELAEELGVPLATLVRRACREWLLRMTGAESYQLFKSANE